MNIDLANRLRRRNTSRMGAYLKYEGVLIPMDDPHIKGRVREVVKKGQYEMGDVRALHALLEDDDIVLEVGAGLGFISCFCAKRVGSDRVFAYEANPEMQKTILRLHEINGVTPTLTMGAVTNFAGSVSLRDGEDFWDMRVLGADKGRHGALVTPSYDIAEEIQRVQPSCLVLDCEGSEREILGGDLNPCVRKLIAELHPELIGNRACNEVIANVMRQGFDIRMELSGGSMWAFERLDH